MGRLLTVVYFATMVAAGALVSDPARAQETSSLGGAWTLNRSVSEFPHEVGFNPSWIGSATTDGQSTGSNSAGRRGRSAGGGGTAASPFPARPESYDEARRVQLLTADVRNPPARLTIVDTPDVVTIVNELGESRPLHPDGKEESIELQGVPIAVTARREGDRLVVLYHVSQTRQLRYTYSYQANPSQLVVDVQFLEHGAGDSVRHVYERSPAPDRPTDGAPASPDQPTTETLDQRPGAELKGLKNLGILVEDLGDPAVACGLNRDSLEIALSRQLTDAGFVVRTNSDEDTYVYINVITTSLPSGICVSRYDAFLYTSATAHLAYRDQSVLAQVSLAHRGGIGSGTLAAHPAAVARGLASFVDLFITQIRDANK